LELAAQNLADWHATSVAAFGCRSQRWPGVWVCDGAVPPIFLQAIALPNGPPAAEVESRLRSVFDEFPPTRPLVIVDYRNDLDLQSLGLVAVSPRPCFWRPAGDANAPAVPAELEIEEVRSSALLSEFERVSAAGFESPLPRGGWHPPAVLDDPRFRVWIGRVDGQAVGAAMAYVGDAVVGIYGVAVAPSARRHGYGAALTWHATRVEAALPAALQPSAMSMGVYRRLGYAPTGEFTMWHRSAR
jgi:ribosomal protein S18 acetylase RimI-like enzyme